MITRGTPTLNFRTPPHVVVSSFVMPFLQTSNIMIAKLTAENLRKSLPKCLSAACSYVTRLCQSNHV
jgi:hypothetical protein